MANTNISRRNFLKTSALTGLGASLVGLADPGSARAAEAPSPGGGAPLPDLGSIPPRAGGQFPVHALTTKPLERVRAAVIGLHRGMEHVTDCLSIEFAEVVAVCDLRDDRAQAAAEACVKQRGRRPAVYRGAEGHRRRALLISAVCPASRQAAFDLRTELRQQSHQFHHVVRRGPPVDEAAAQ